MSQDRVLGSMVQLQVFGASGASPGPIALAEIDSFSAKNKTSLMEHRPLGQVAPHGQLAYGGWELSFEIGKIDVSLENVQDANDAALLAGQAAPRYRIVETTTFFNGDVRTNVYEGVLLYDFDVAQAQNNEVVKQRVTGFASTRNGDGGLGGFLNDLSNIFNTIGL